LAYHIEVLHRMKRLPKLEKLYAKKATRKRQTWQEQMAIMDQWAAVMEAVTKAEAERG
jgi:hypothetical protein